jgi:CRISPR-associated protein Csx10
MKTVVVPYTLRLTRPVIMTTPSGDPNSASSMKHIPGSSIRGVVARGIEEDNPSLLESLILSGKVTYLNAYPEVAGRRTLPMPYSYRVEKNDDSQVHDLAAYGLNDWPETQMKKPQHQFVTITGPDKYVAEVDVSSRIHHQRDRAMGRAWEKDGESRGTVFVYDHMAENQSFKGCVVIAGKDTAEVDSLVAGLKGLIGTSLILGRSRRAGYGGNATITWQDQIPREISATGETEVIEQDIVQGSRFRIMLLSDCILRSSTTGQVDPSLIASELEVCLEGKARVSQTYFYSRLVGGYNRKWGLEIPQSLAVGAGSLLVMEATDDIPLTMIHSIENAGVGERKIEGLGRLVFLSQPSTRVILKDYTEPPHHEHPRSNPPQIIIEMERRILQKELMRECDLMARDIAARFVTTKKSHRIPSNSLIGRLRVPLRGPSETSLDILRDWFDTSSKNSLRSPAMNQLRSSRLKIDGRPMTLLDWLKFIINANYKDLQTLGSEKLCQDKHIISPESARDAISHEITNVRTRIIDVFLSEVVRLRKVNAGGAD